MAEFDPNTVTVGELAKIYAEEQGLKSPLSLGKLLAPYKDQPALAFFAEKEGEPSLARQAVKSGASEVTENSLKGSLKTMRYLSNRLYNAYDTSPPPYLVSNEKNVPATAQEYFGTKEPKKAVSSIQVSVVPEKRKAFVREILKYGAANPEKMPEVRAIVFGLSTGLRPNASLGLAPGNYFPENGALYISGEETGAKGRAISVPLSSVADSMIQQQLDQFGPQIKEADTIFLNSEGKPIKTAAINEILSEIKVDNLLYDKATGEWFDSFKPAREDKAGKFGMSLFRNFHASLGNNELGIDARMMGKLQGRSQSSIAKGPGVGEFFTYVSDIPGEVSEYEREQANLIGDTLAEGIQEAETEIQQLRPDFKFDHGADTDRVKTRITGATEGYGRDYFKRKVVAPSETATAAPKAPKGLTEEDKAGVLKRLTDWSKGALDSPTTKAIAGIGLTGMGISAAQRLEAAEERVAAGEGEMPAYLKEGARFVAEEFTPAGFIEPAKEVIGAGLKAGAEAAQKEAEEKGISGDIEAQIRSVLGVPPQF